MDPAAIVAIFTAVGTLLGAAGGFLAKSRLGDVVVSKSKREETAVEYMAECMKAMTDARHDREIKLIGLHEKALETVGHLSGAIQSFTLALQAHEHDMLEVGQVGHETAQRILESITATQGEVREMAVMLTELARDMTMPEVEAAGD